MKKTAFIIIMALAALAAPGASAQDAYAPILAQIEENSTTLAALRQRMEAEKTANSAGLAPANPEVEFGYLWGSPGDIGNRKDITVRQEFDFPTVYGKRRGVARKKDLSAGYEYQVQRQAVLLRAKDLCINLTYAKALLEIRKRQLDNARRITDNLHRLDSAGNVTRLDLNKAMVHLTVLESEVGEYTLVTEQLLAELTRMNGGVPVVFDINAFDNPALPADFDALYAEMEAKCPELLLNEAQVEVGRQEVSLAKAQGLPKWSVGYQGEYVMGANFSGFTVGVSIPLWENRNKVKSAQANVEAARLLAYDERVSHRVRLRNLFDKATDLREDVDRYKRTFSAYSNDELLFKSYTLGELTLLDYLLESEYFFSAYERCLEAERDLQLAVAELNSFAL